VRLPTSVRDAAPILGHSPRSGLALSVMHQTVRANGCQWGQRAFQGALLDSGIQKHATVHTLRHSTPPFAGKRVNLRLIQSYLGHASPNTTAIYTHLTKPSEDLRSRLSIASWRDCGIRTGDIFRQYGPAYRQKYSDRILPLTSRRCAPSSSAGLRL